MTSGNCDFFEIAIRSQEHELIPQLCSFDDVSLENPTVAEQGGTGGCTHARQGVPRIWAVARQAGSDVGLITVDLITVELITVELNNVRPNG